jgi:photosystem II stability/assembly factor-like uncharacterized protein
VIRLFYSKGLSTRLVDHARSGVVPNRGVFRAAVFLFLLFYAVPSNAQVDTTNVWFSNGPTGQVFINQIVIDPQSPDTLYAGTLPGTVFRSLNRGGSWTEVGASISDTVSSLAINPKNSAVLYAGTISQGVYKSTNNGSFWSPINTGLPDSLINVIAIDPADTNKVFVGSSDSLFVSTDGGATWVSAGLDSVVVSDILFNPQAPDTIYVGTDSSGVFRSRDGGTTWVQVNNGLGSLRISGMAIHPTQPDTLYSVTLDMGLFRSTDGGTTWTANNIGLTATNLSSIAIAPDNPNVLYVGTSSPAKIFKSADNGNTWSDITRNLPGGPGVGSLAVHPDSAHVVYASIISVQRFKQLGLDEKLVLSTQRIPGSVGVGDIDGDGAFDPLLTNASSSSISLLRNLAQGAVFVQQELIVGGEPNSISTGDLDGDGDEEVVVGNGGSQVVTVLFNDGNGAFPSRLDLFLGQAPAATTLADIDGDGFLDVLSATGAPGNSVSLFLNNGLGNFFSQRLFPCGSDPVALTVEDFNGDGLPDVLTANRDAHTVNYLQNVGNGLFNLPVAFGVGASPIDIVSGDFDQDGNPDAALIMESRWELVLLENLGAAKFEVRKRHNLETLPLDLQSGDMDGDRYVDLLVSGTNRPVLFFSNTGNGDFILAAQAFEDALSINSLDLADLDSDGDPDLFGIQSGSQQLHVRRNDLALDIKLPASPRDITAEDVQGDLGGRIKLTWNQAWIDEETGRVTRYQIYRSQTTEGPYGLIGEIDTTHTALLPDSITVLGTYVDSSAVVNLTYSYYLRGVGINASVSAPSDTVSALSTPQPFFVIEFSGEGVYHVGDSIAVAVSLIPLDHEISGVSLFLNYDKTALSILDADPQEAGIQPIYPAASTLLSSQVLENRLNKGLEGHINYSIAGFTAADSSRVDLGSLRFVALKDTLTFITVVDSPSVNRSTVVIEQGTGSVVAPYLFPGTYGLNIQGVRLFGRVVLQGRNGQSGATLRVDLRKSNGTGLDTLYRPSNDLDQNFANGVQIRSNDAGQFEIIQVPSRTYSVFVKAFHYLRSRVSGDSVVVGVASPPELQFKWVSSTGVVVTDTLRGGDGNNDDRVNLADFGILASHFGVSRVVEGDPEWNADFNGDGAINLADFGILASNFGETGVGQSLLFKPAVGPARFALQEVGEGIYTLNLAGQGRVRGISAEIRSTNIQPVRIERQIETGGRANQTHWIERRVSSDRIRIAAYARKDAENLSGDTEIVRIWTGGPPPDLQDLWIMDTAGRLISASLSDRMDEAETDLPDHPALYQNTPNPFNPSTTIRYDVSELSQVSLTIYSILGQKVENIIQENLQPGSYTSVWNGRDDKGRLVASGVYFYQISIGKFKDVKKLMLLR